MKEKPPKPSLFLIMLILINIFGCQNNSNPKKEQGQYDTTKLARNAQAKKSITGLKCDSTITSQEFSMGTLAIEVFKADTNKIKSLFLDPVTLKMKKATSEEGEPYNLYDFTDGTNEIVLYNNEGFYIEEADIKNDRVLLNKKISIGMKQATFLELLKVKNIKCDTITVADEEFTFESIYVFKNGELRQVQMESTAE